MKRKIATIREKATERVQVGVIGALGIVISLFVLLGNVSFKPMKMNAVSDVPVDTIGIGVESFVPPTPPPVQKVAQFDVAKQGDKITDSLPPDQPDSFILTPGRDKLIRTLDSVKFIPREAKYPVVIGELDVPYPSQLRMRGIYGTAVITAGLDEQGYVFAAKVTKSSGNATLDSLALNGVLKARFTPAMQGNTPFAVKINIPIMFQLDR